MSCVLLVLASACAEPQPVDAKDLLGPFRRARACPATSRIDKSILSSVPLKAPGELASAYASFTELGADGELMRVLMSTAEIGPEEARTPGELARGEVRFGVGVRSFDGPVRAGSSPFAHDASRQVFAEARRPGFPTGVLAPGPKGKPMRNEHGELEIHWMGPDYVCGRFSFGHANGRFEGRFKARRLD